MDWFLFFAGFAAIGAGICVGSLLGSLIVNVGFRLSGQPPAEPVLNEHVRARMLVSAIVAVIGAVGMLLTAPTEAHAQPADREAAIEREAAPDRAPAPERTSKSTGAARAAKPSKQAPQRASVSPQASQAYLAKVLRLGVSLSLLLGLWGAGLTYLLRAAAKLVNATKLLENPPLSCNLCMSCWGPLLGMLALWKLGGGGWALGIWGFYLAVGLAAIPVARLAIEAIERLSAAEIPDVDLG